MRAAMAMIYAYFAAFYADVRDAFADSWRPEMVRQGFLAGANRGQGNLSSLFIGIMVATIIGVAVVIPVINDTIEQSNISGTELTIIGLIPLFVALLLLISLASPLMKRT